MATEIRDQWIVAPHKLRFELRFNGRTYATGVKHDLIRIANQLNELAAIKDKQELAQELAITDIP